MCNSFYYVIINYTHLIVISFVILFIVVFVAVVLVVMLLLFHWFLEGDLPVLARLVHLSVRFAFVFVSLSRYSGVGAGAVRQMLGQPERSDTRELLLLFSLSNSLGSRSL